ncbi:hypothetical protein [uncultured Caulobacter sp.]|uniref:hypothetical protein n=1 Tax=uncultured Caulobacter sp. TaxID=158749 RepID=UPI00262939A4|nr:hypothetical protein [uncultured Caulobacter sp.]
MAKAPPIPPEQRAAPGDKPDLAGATADGETLQSGQPGDADANLAEQGRQGGVKQNTTHQGYQQDR